jgi:hypothetical protein
MERGYQYDPCDDEDIENCRLAQPGLDRDHIYYPKKEYRTALEREFRNLPENIVLRCICKHRRRHAEEAPPLKPPREEMLRAIGKLGVSSIGDCK